jgi:hypothetical protein
VRQEWTPAFFDDGDEEVSVVSRTANYHNTEMWDGEDRPPMERSDFFVLLTLVSLAGGGVIYVAYNFVVGLAG